MNVVTYYKTDLTPSLISEIAELLEEGFDNNPSELWKKRFAYWWLSNPYIAKDTACGWGLVDDENKLVGFLGNIPQLFQYGDKQLLGCGSSSYYVKPEFRGPLTTLLNLNRVRQKNADFVMSTTANPHAKKFIEANKYKPASTGTINNCIIFSSLSSLGYVMNDKFKQLAGSKTGVMRAVYRAFAGICFAVGAVCPKAKPNHGKTVLSSPTHELRICTDAKTFAKHIRLHENKNSIEFSKDDVTVNRMFFSQEVQNLLKRKSVLVFTKTGEYCGYFVTDIKDAVYPYLRLTELKLLNPDNATVKLILKYLKSEAKNNGCSMVNTVLQSPDSKTDELIRKNTLFCNKKENKYFVKFKKGAVTDADPYEIFVPSTLDPDVGFI